MKLLVITDNVKFFKKLSHTLREHGYVVDHAADGPKALEITAIQACDLIILEWKMSKRAGVSILKEIRSQGFDIPVFVIGENDSPQERADGLDSGADDFLSQPFAMEEFLARLRALSRRGRKALVGNTIVAGGLTLDPLKCEVMDGHQVIRLSVKEALLLEILMRNLGKVITKELIFERVWGYQSDIQFANIDLYIHYLRKKLNNRRIKTVRGIGYYLAEAECNGT
jgi:DNA-binding response OmpR family regulator